LGVEGAGIEAVEWRFSAPNFEVLHPDPKSLNPKPEIEAHRMEVRNPEAYSSTLKPLQRIRG